jgi:arylsulfatase A-like enzyme
MRIKRREFLKVAAAGTGLAGLNGLGAFASSKDRPNVVLCMADDQGWGDMAYCGHPVLDAGKITRQYPEDRFPGHAAWLDWPWKLHRIEKEGPARIELYNLSDDPQEGRDLATAQPDRTESMRRQLETWLSSVGRRLNGKDYL